MRWVQVGDITINGFWFFYLLATTVLVVARWIQRGRIESYSEADLTPKWLRPWSWGEPRSGQSVTRRSLLPGPLTTWGWIFVAVVAGWLFIKWAA